MEARKLILGIGNGFKYCIHMIRVYIKLLIDKGKLSANKNQLVSPTS